MQLILASKSPRRRELLAKICPDFSVITAGVDASGCRALPARAQCAELARLKAAAVFAAHPECCVVGCDTLVELDGKIYGKPADRDDARRIISALSGRRHNVFTGVCVLSPLGKRSFVCRSGVEFFPLSDAEIERYIATDEPYDKAGGYGIQDAACVFVKSISGDYFNIMGLPLSRLYRALLSLGIAKRA